MSKPPTPTPKEIFTAGYLAGIGDEYNGDSDAERAYARWVDSPPPRAMRSKSALALFDEGIFNDIFTTEGEKP